MTCSLFDVFKVGVGPSSSHTVGPMLAARRFVLDLADAGQLSGVTRLRVQLFGSLGASGWGHGTGTAVVLGLAGESPDTVVVETMNDRVHQVRTTHQLVLMETDPQRAHQITFDPSTDLVRHLQRRLRFHPNAMQFTAWAGRTKLADQIYYSIGGGAIVADDGTGSPPLPADDRAWVHRFTRGSTLVDLCNEHQLTIPELMMANETALAPREEVEAGIDRIWSVMTQCIDEGCSTEGTLPGGLFVTRRAPGMKRLLSKRRDDVDPLAALDWVTLWALATNEQNAAGGRIVTAPTNGAAGIVPAVGMYARQFLPGVDDVAIRDYLLTAAALCVIFKASGSISGAEVGCQGEVGCAAAMAAAGLAQPLGGTPQQVVNAAEIALEHHLGLTCDPIGGLVQIPCIERNAIGAVKAITAARLAINDDGFQYVSLDNCVRTMMETGLDMNSKYKETARGGLAVNIVDC